MFIGLLKQVAAVFSRAHFREFFLAGTSASLSSVFPQDARMDGAWNVCSMTWTISSRLPHLVSTDCVINVNFRLLTLRVTLWLVILLLSIKHGCLLPRVDEGDYSGRHPIFRRLLLSLAADISRRFVVCVVN